jgi:K+-sensing histidine kinase KdpD
MMRYGGYSLLFLGAVVISARYGGLLAGLVATLLSGASLHYFFIPPAYSFIVHDVGSLLWLSMFVFVAFLISTLSESRKREEEKLRSSKQELEARIAERTTEVNVLKELLPICACCKKIRNAKGRWAGLENYMREHPEATFNRSICPECAKQIYPNYPFADSAP